MRPARLASRLLRYAWCLAMLGGVAAVLPGCTEFMMDSGVFEGTKVNLLETSYDAADMLAQKSKGQLRPGTPIRIGTLANAYPAQPARTVSRSSTITATPLPDGSTQTTDTTHTVVDNTPAPVPVAPFGKVISEQIGGRFVDLGFNVVGGSGLARPGQALLTGQYARSNGRVLVSLRLIDSSTGHVLGAFDYTMPISPEIADLLGQDERGSGFFDF